jgi:fumarate hydratase subunit beta
VATTHKLTTPLTSEALAKLKPGDKVLLTGVVYSGRDAAHERMMKLLDKGEKLPFDVKGAAIFYVGPSPTKPGDVIGSAGPTTSYRMDEYSPRLLDLGLKCMIGKGNRAKAVIDSMIKNKAVYLAAIGGAAALTAQTIKKCDIVAWEDLGPEAVRRLEVVDMPLVVVNDIRGGDLYDDGRKKYEKK